MWIYLNNKFVTDEDAVISVFDHGFLYGDGVYETLRSYGPRIFMRDEHLSRLLRSAEAIGLTIPISMTSLADILHEAMIRNEVGTEQRDAYLRVTVSRGTGDIGLDPALCPSPTVVVMANPLVPPASHLYETGVNVIIASTKRNLPSALSPQIKATNFLNNIQAKREAIAAGAFDSLLLNWEQHLTECTISNLFFALDGTLRTPALECGLLDGITRMVVIRLAGELNMHVEEGRYTVDQLFQADECFLTNTTMEIMPVTSIDRRPVGDGTPGPLTRKLREQFLVIRGR
ncbi:putative branched-chain-amino-acid aminotransferase [Candidatus Nitrospira nitrificans]|uniref:branched-chain-amino-acid transaminase n=1 Tax=Candidatus Nitrospira nitrificans TaxID=1742973 RepID=A0A0S4LIK2_9BACT|nr:putative branched-chain-amino-acid aminotransferase [Candidatus Nitrospira nitrificans]